MKFLFGLVSFGLISAAVILIMIRTFNYMKNKK